MLVGQRLDPISIRARAKRATLAESYRLSVVYLEAKGDYHLQIVVINHI